MFSYDGKYFLIDPRKVDKIEVISYDKGNNTQDWLNFVYDQVAPESRLIDVVRVGNDILPMFFSDIDIIVDDEGLLRPPVILNPIASALADQPLFGSALLAFRALDQSKDGYHCYPMSSSPAYKKIVNFFKGMPEDFGTFVGDPALDEFKEVNAEE